MSFTVVTDTSANLPSPLLAQRAIGVIPFTYVIDGLESTCLNTETFNGPFYYDRIRRGARVTTAQINPQQYADAWEPLLAAVQDVLFVGMSSGISGSYQSACIAAAQLRDEYPDRRICTVDTMGASLGEGIPALRAADYRDRGLDVEDAARLVAADCRRMCQVFVVDDLMHLRRTGRLTGAAAVVGTVLQIKPLLKGNELGQIVNFAKARGRKQAVEMLAAKYDALAVEPETQIVGIAHADCPETAAFLERLLCRNRPPKEIMTVCYEPVTGSHVGPGTLALFFMGADDVRSK